MKKGTLYLIPSLLGDLADPALLPAAFPTLLNSLDTFICESEKSARKSLRQGGFAGNIDKTVFLLLNEHTPPADVRGILEPLLNGKNTGLLSDAGSPVIADPGAALIRLAHKEGITVVPLPGPSSVTLALMASGFNGQEFEFHGYLPKDEKERVNKIRQMEKAATDHITQIFIETPYRNNKLIAEILKTLGPSTQLCIACDLTLPSESILTMNISEWKKTELNYDKRPAVFLIGK